MPTWIQVLSDFEGLIGALFGAYAGFFGSYFTARHTQKIEMEKFARENEKLARERTVSGTASLIETIMMGGSDGLADTKKVEGLVQKLVLFSVREVHDHPDAAEWAHRQSIEVARAAHEDQHFGVLLWQVQYINDQLFQWARSDYPDDFFSTEDDFTEARSAFVESLDPALKVTRGEAVDPTPSVDRKLVALSHHWESKLNPPVDP